MTKLEAYHAIFEDYKTELMHHLQRELGKVDEYLFFEACPTASVANLDTVNHRLTLKLRMARERMLERVRAAEL